MKLVTKMRRFVGKMEEVENMNEKQLRQMLLKAEAIMAEYIADENRKEEAYMRVKEASKYWSGRGRKAESVKAEEVVEEVAVESVEEAEEVVEEITKEIMNEVAVTIQVEQPQENIINEEVTVMNTVVNSVANVSNDTRLVVTKLSEEKGHMIGVYYVGEEATYFSSSNTFDYPVVFGNATLTKDIKDAIVSQYPKFYKPVTKDFKSLALFGKINGQQAMVYLADAKRQVFEGYIGDMVFSTTMDYINKGYKPLVTQARVFVVNGGKHSHPSMNACTDAMKDLIIGLIRQYMSSAKYVKATNDIEYFKRLSAAKAEKAKVEVEVAVKPAEAPVVQPEIKNLGYSAEDVLAAVNSTYCYAASSSIGGDDNDYEPEF